MTSNNMTHWSHSNHPHPLAMIENGENRYECNGCKMDGIGKRYRCNGCDFDLHHSCMFPCNSITIQGQECYFYEKPPLGIHCKKPNCTKCRSCDACGMTILGFVYHSPVTDKDFHPTCVNLKSELRIEDVTLTLQTKHGVLSKCAWCKRKLAQGADKKVPGWSYVAEGEDYNLHVNCVMKMLMQSQSSSSKLNGGTTGDDRDSTFALKGKAELPLKNKFKKVSNTTIKWLRILKFIIGSVFSILLGDPSTLIASAMAHVIVEGLANVVDSCFLQN